MNQQPEVRFSDTYDGRLEKCYSGALHDVLRAMEFHDHPLPQAIRPHVGFPLKAGQVHQ